MTIESLMMKPLCIYHGGCDDGFAAAWVVRKALKGNVDFHHGTYQQDPPPHAGRDIIMVDFSYKRPVLTEMAKHANSILILDHHKTAQEDLADIPAPRSFEAWRKFVWLEMPNVVPRRHMAALFDMERSGAALAWDYFIGSERPTFIDYIQDRDLWRKQLPGGDEFTIALRSYPQYFEVWDELIGRGVKSLIDEGTAIQRYYRLRVEELKRHAYRARIGEHAIWITNAPYFAASEVAGELAERNGVAFGACYFEVAPGKYQYSLRSRGDFDVSAVARRFGGGGHQSAAGFTTPVMAHRHD